MKFDIYYGAKQFKLVNPIKLKKPIECSCGEEIKAIPAESICHKEKGKQYASFNCTDCNRAYAHYLGIVPKHEAKPIDRGISL